MFDRAAWRRLLIALALPTLLSTTGGAVAGSCAGTDAFGGVFTFSSVPDTLTFGERLSYSLAVSGTISTDSAAGLDFVDGPRYGSVADQGTAATSTEAAIAGYAPSAAAGTRTLLGYPVPGTHYFRTSRSVAANAAPCVTIVSKNASTSVVSASPTTSTYGDEIGLSAAVSAATLPTGTVSFADSGSTIATATLAARPVMATAALGTNHACVVTAGGGLSCWGENSAGQLGNGTTTALTLANAAAPFTSGVAGVAAGTAFTCAVKTDGKVWCWGLGTSGQLGNGAAASRSTPDDVSAISNVRTVVAGDAHACALTSAGAVWCWGNGGTGRLGDGTGNSRSSPVQVISSGIKALAAGSEHTCALDVDGAVKCWGSNGSGQTGTGASRSVPTAVSSLTATVTAIAAGGEETCALLADTTVRCWGANTYGQIGDGTVVARSAPTTVSGLSGVISLSVGDLNVCAVKSDGTVACWGYGDNGRIGDGTANVANQVRIVTTPRTVADFSESGSIFQLNGKANASSPDFTTRPAGVVVGGGRTLVVSDLGAVTGWGALSVPSIQGTTYTLSPTALSGARSVRLDAVASAITTAVAGGTNRALTATYGGDSYRLASTSDSVSVAVTPADTSVTGFTLTPASIQFGDSVTLQATVSPAMSQGTVEFFDGSTVVGTASVSGGVAQTTSTTIPVGNRTIGARYVANDNYNASTATTTRSITVTRRTAVVSIAADKTTPEYGETVRVTVTVTPTAASGQVTLLNGSTSIGSATLSNGQAVFTLSTLTPGVSHVLTASYLGDANVDAASSSSVTIAVKKLTVSISASTSPSSPRYGDNVTVTASITSPLALGGSVSFQVAGQTASATVQSGNTASATFSGIAAGTYQVTATFSGDSLAFGASTTTSMTMLKKIPSISLSAVATSGNPRYGETFTLQITVTPSTAPGDVTVSQGSTTLGTATLTDGFATLDITATETGSVIYTIDYPESANFAAVTSNLSVTIDKGDTSISLDASDAVYGQSTTITATVISESPASGVPGGTVRFFDGGAILGDGVLDSSGQATFTRTITDLGSHDLTATYLGSSSFNGSTGASATQTVTQATATVGVTASKTATRYLESVTFTAAVTAASPGSGLPTGSVTFYDGSTVLTTVALASVSGVMKATYTTSDLVIATHEIVAVYSGDTNFVSGASGSLNYTVNRTAVVMTLYTDKTTASLGSGPTLSVLLPLGDDNRKPTGSISFFNGATLIGTSTFTDRILNTHFTNFYPSLGVGTHTLSAFYGGDDNFDATQSNTVTVTVPKVTSYSSIYVRSATDNALVTADIDTSQSLVVEVLVDPLTGSKVTDGTITISDSYAAKATPTVRTEVVLATVALDADHSTSKGGVYATVTLPGGYGNTHLISATFTGSSTYLDSTSPTYSVTVEKATPAITLTASTASVSAATTSVTGEAVTFTASVAATGYNPGRATGSVVFKAGSASAVSVAMSNGKAIWTTKALPSAATTTVTANYAGDSRYLEAAEVSRAITVGAAGSEVAVSAPTTMVSGQAASLTGTVAAASPGTGTPTGGIAVVDADSGDSVGTATLSSGAFSVSLAGLDVGTHRLKAVYAGNGSVYTGSESSVVTVVVNKATAAVTLSGPTTRVSGQSGTLTVTAAAVTPGTGTPTGTVALFTSAGTLATLTLTNGSATFDTAGLAVGSYSLRGAYSGDGAFNTVTSSAFTLVVSKAQTSTVLTAPSSSVYGQAVTLTAAVSTVSPGTGTPTGTVTFLDGTETIGSVTLQAGTASLTTTGLTAASHKLQATYSGDASFATSLSASQTLTVSKADVAIALSAPSTAVSGEAVTLTAALTAVAPGAGTPTGTIAFMEGSRTLGVATLQAGAATLSGLTLSVGSHAITASYGGDSAFKALVSSASTLTVAKATSTTTISLPSSAVHGQTVTLSTIVTAAAPSANIPSGSVLFRLDGSLLASTNLDATGKASTTATLSAGNRTLSVSYLGDTGVAASQSASTALVVAAGNTTVTLSGPSSAAAGQSVTLTATVAAVSPATGFPTGTVQFLDGTTVLGTGTLSRGTATFTTAALAVGARSLTARYVGDANFTTATSAAVSPTIGVSPVDVTVSAPTPRTYGASTTVTATVRARFTAAGTPAGTVTFRDGATVIGQATIANGQASVTTTALAIGAHTLTATYEGNATFATGTASTSVTVTKASTTTTLAVAGNPVVGQTITATVAVQTTTAGPLAPGGTVDIYDGSVRIGGGTVTAGAASVSLPALAIGRHALTAIATGDDNYAGSTSASLQVTVGKGSVTAGLAVAPTAPVAGQSVTVTASVAAAAPAVGTPTGTVTVRDGSVVIGTGTLTAGVATVILSAPTAGAHALSLSYPGDTSFLPGTASLTLTVAKAETVVTLTGPSDTTFGQSASYAVTVTPVSPGTGTPGGKVVFSDGTSTLGSITLSGGSGSFSLATLPAGARSVTAAYQGDPSYLAGTSAAVATAVAKAATTVTLAAAPTVVRPGGSVVLTATAAGSAAAGTPTGSITFREGTTTAGSVALSLGKASLTRTLSTSGSVTFTASYPGSGNLLASSGTAVVTVDASLGDPAAVPTTATGLQEAPALARQTSGGTVAVWTAPDGSGTGVFSRRYLSTGTAAAVPARVNSVTAGDQQAAAVAGLSTGGYVVVWQSTGQDGSGTSIHFQRYSANGGLVGSETRANLTTSGDQKTPSVTGLADGRFAIGWTTRSPSATTDTAVLRLFTGTGTAATGEIALDPTATDQDAVKLVTLNGGSVVAGWAAATSSATTATVRLRLVAADGSLTGSVKAIASVPRDQDRALSLAATADGGAVLAYAAASGSKPTAVVLRRYSAALAQVGGGISAGASSTLAEREPTVAAFPAGGFVVAWTADTATGSVIGYQRYRADGTAADTAQSIVVPSVAIDQPAAGVRTDTAFDILFATNEMTGDVLRSSFALGAAAP